jgi:DNA-binding NarL/FixJ family response regulator
MSGTGMSGAGDITVVVADDQALVRAGLATLLDSQPGLAVVGQAGDGQEAVRLAREARPDVVLMDVRMPLLDGLAATRRIAAEQAAGQAARPVRVVILTTYDLDEYVYEALRAGACGFLLKHAPPEELLLGVRAAADGGALLSPAVTKRLLAEFTARRPAVPAPAALAGLTSREREVLDLVVRGRSNAEIATQLVVTQSTVKTHVGHILDKLGLRDRVHAVVFGYEHGLVEPGSR